MAPKVSLPKLKSAGSKKNLQSSRCSLLIAADKKKEVVAAKKKDILRHANAELPPKGEEEAKKKFAERPHTYRKVPWTSPSQAVVPKAAPKIDIVAEVRRAMALPAPTTQSFHQQARQEQTSRWNACQALSDEALHCVDELIVRDVSFSTPGTSPNASRTLEIPDHTPASSSSSMHEAFLRTQSDRGLNLFSVGKCEEADDLGRQRMNYARDLVSGKGLEDADGKQVQDLFSSRIALLRNNPPSLPEPQGKELESPKASFERVTPTSQRGSPLYGLESEVAKEQHSVFSESEAYHDEGFRRLRRFDFRGSLEVLEAAWGVMDQELMTRDSLDQEEIAKVRQELENKEQEQELEFHTKPNSNISDDEPHEVKLILLRSSERLKIEKQQKISLGFDLALVYARLLEWEKVDEVCEIVLRFYGSPGELPTLSSSEEEEKWIHFTIRRAVACAFLGEEHFGRARSYLEDVLKLLPKHKRARRCLQCLDFLKEQLPAAEARSAMLAALQGI